MADDDNNNNDNEEVCKVFDKNDFFTILVQMLLAVCALGFLWIKRMHEVPRRKFLTWFLDVSKQAFGACYAHVLNMVIAAVIIKNIRGDGNVVLEDQCAWYGMCYLVDTTLGLVLAIGFIKLLDYAAHENDWLTLKHSGVYVGTEGLIHWVHQVIAWLVILSVVKVIIFGFMWLFSAQLAALGGILFAPLQFNIRFELVFVMILFPGVLNVIYFWIADSYLQAKKEHADAHEPEESGLEDKKESLLTEGEKEKGEGNKAYGAKPWTSLEQKPENTSI